MSSIFSRGDINDEDLKHTVEILSFLPKSTWLQNIADEFFKHAFPEEENFRGFENNLLKP